MLYDDDDDDDDKDAVQCGLRRTGSSAALIDSKADRWQSQLRCQSHPSHHHHYFDQNNDYGDGWLSFNVLIESWGLFGPRLLAGGP